jgi:cell division protein FtsB
MKWCFLLCFLLVAVGSFAQLTEKERIQQLELQRENEKTRAVRAQMDAGIQLLNQGEYEQADEKFKYALANMKSIPSDLTFFFGKNSFYMGRNKQGVDWLTKYIQLKGTSGQYSAEAADLLKKAEIALVGEHQVATVKTTELLSRDYDIDCGPSGKVKCPVCNGATVIIKKDYLGETYKSCPYCNQKGMLTCEDYNKLLRGQLKAVE